MIGINVVNVPFVQTCQKISRYDNMLYPPILTRFPGAFTRVPHPYNLYKLAVSLNDFVTTPNLIFRVIITQSADIEFHLQISQFPSAVILWAFFSQQVHGYRISALLMSFARLFKYINSNFVIDRYLSLIGWFLHQPMISCFIITDCGGIG